MLDSTMYTGRMIKEDMVSKMRTMRRMIFEIACRHILGGVLHKSVPYLPYDNDDEN